jgi:hypothetical protein
MTKTLREACRSGHPLIEGAFRWKTDGSRSCIECERIRRVLNHDRIAARQAQTRRLAKERRLLAAAALEDFRQDHHRRVA